MPPDPRPADAWELRSRDTELIEAIVGSVRGMLTAVHLNDTPALVGSLALLVNAMIEHRDAMAERRLLAPF